MVSPPSNIHRVKFLNSALPNYCRTAVTMYTNGCLKYCPQRARSDNRRVGNTGVFLGSRSVHLYFIDKILFRIITRGLTR